MKTIKKRSVYASTIVVVVLILFFIISDVSEEFLLYKSFEATISEIAKNLNFLEQGNTSYEGEINRIKNGKTYKIANISNNKDFKELNLTLYNKNGRGEVYIGENMVGLGVHGDTSRQFTADSESFCTSWNNSVYSNYLKIPSAVPDNLNYDTVNSSLYGKNMLYILFGALGNVKKSDIDSLAGNITVARKENIEIVKNGKSFDCKHYVVSLSTDSIVKIITSLNKSYMFEGKLEKLKNDIGKSGVKTQSVDILCQGGKVILVETTVNSKNCIWNVKLENTGTTQLFSVDSYFSKIPQNILSVICKEGSNTFTAQANIGNTYVSIEADSDKNSNKTFLYTKYDDNSHDTYVISLKNVEKQQKNGFYGKDIYNASLGDLYDIYRHFPAIFSIK